MSFWLTCLLLIPCAEPSSDAVAVQHWRRQLHSEDTLTRQDAADALGRLGPRAEADIPDLVKMLSEESVRRPAALALARIGPRAIPSLLDALEKPDSHEAAGLALARLGPVAVPALIRRLKDRNLSRAGQAARTLGEMGPSAEAAIPALVEAARAHRLHYEYNLQKIEIEVAGVPELRVPKLEIKDDSWELSFAALAALEKIGPQAVPALAKLLRPRQPKSRAATVLSLLVSACTDVLPALFVTQADENAFVSAALVATQLLSMRARLQEMDSETRILVAYVLATMGPSARAAAPDLLRCLVRSDGATVSRLHDGGWNALELHVTFDDGGELIKRLPRATTFKRCTLKALHDIRFESPAVIPALLAALRSKHFVAHSHDLTEMLLGLGQPGEAALLRSGLPILLERLQQKDPLTWVSASLALERLGQRGKPILPLLDRLMRQKEPAPVLRSVPTWRLVARLGKDGLPVLERALKHPKIEICLAACLGLKEAGASARHALPLLHRMLPSPDHERRKAVAEVLVMVDPDPEIVAAQLRSVLKEEYATIDDDVHHALVLLGPAAKALIPELRARLSTAVKNENREQILSTAQALLEAGAPPREPLERICALLTTEELRKVCHTLRELGTRARGATPALLRLMPRAEREDRYHLAWTLAVVAPDQRHTAVPALLALLDKPDADWKALQILPEFLGGEREALSPASQGDDRDPGALVQARPRQPQHDSAVRHLVGLLGTRESPSVALVLGRLGTPAARAAVPVLLPQLQSLSSWERASTAVALGGLGQRQRVVPRLLKLLDDEEVTARVAAAAALIRLTGSTPSLESLLVREIRKHPEVADVVVHFGPGAGRFIVPALIAALEERDPSVRAGAASSLGRIGPEAMRAVPRLIALLDDGDALVRERAVKSLGQIGPDARAARSRLQTLVGDGHGRLARAAAWSLRALDERGPPFTPADRDGVFKLLEWRLGWRSR